jgi:hypothetical protein
VAAIATTLHPAHGPSVPVEVAHRYVAHRHMRTRQFTEALAAAGPSTAEEVAGVVYAGIPGVDLSLAALQVCTHLAWLEARGRVRASGDRWHLTA